MEKPQLVNFIANILEDSGFKVYKNFKTTQQIVDIYAVLPTSMGDFALVVACKNYDKEWTVGIDVLKEMEMVGKNLKASKVCIITSSKFSEQSIKYGEERHIKLVDRNGLIKLAKKYNDKKKEEEAKKAEEEITNFYDYYSTQPDSYNESYDEYYDGEEDLEYIQYDEYDDNRYRAQYLVNSRPIGNLNRNSGQRPNTSLNRGGRPVQKKSRSSRRNPSIRRQNNPYNNRRVQKESKPIGETIKTYLKNPVIDILVVVVVSYLISELLGGLAKIPTGYLGLTELVVALLLSYGIVFYSDRDHRDPLIKGTAIFFISLIILMILIILV